MNKLMRKIRNAAALVLTGVIAVFLLALAGTVRARSRVEGREEERDELFAERAGRNGAEAEDAVRSRTARSVAAEYASVGDAVDEGRNRFAHRVKNRVVAAGGRRTDEQHPE